MWSKYGAYRNVRFCDIFPDLETFKDEYTASAIPLTTLVAPVSDANVANMYYMLYARYGNSPIVSSDVNQWKYRLWTKIFQFAPTWIKRLKIQDDVRKITQADLEKGGEVVYNHATNPNVEPSTETLEHLPIIDSQNTQNFKKSKIEALGLQWAMLEDDVTGYFLEQFKSLFLKFVMPEFTWLYPAGDE